MNQENSMEIAQKFTPAGSDSCDYFSFHGNIDATAEAQLKDLPRKIQRQVVKFDFSTTGRINSMGLALLLRCLKTIKEEKKAEIRLIQPNPMNTMLFRMTGVLLLADLDK
jgi:anti-anti-sigma regulatory factor